VEKVVFRQQRCKGCELCTLVCPHKIIVMSDTINSMGYHPAAVTDQDKCTSCAICALVCPDLVIEVYKEERGKAVG